MANRVFLLLLVCVPLSIVAILAITQLENFQPWLTIWLVVMGLLILGANLFVLLGLRKK